METGTVSVGLSPSCFSLENLGGRSDGSQSIGSYEENERLEMKWGLEDLEDKAGSSRAILMFWPLYPGST